MVLICGQSSSALRIMSSKMAFSFRSSFLLFGFCGLLTGAWSKPTDHAKENCCPKGWTQVDCRCFIYQDRRRALADAESVCNILGGNLASVHSALEYAVVLELVRASSDSTDDVWLGLHEAIEEGSFFWTDGSEVDFTAFNNDDDDGDCIELEFSDGLWDNDSCSDTNRFVCARDADQCEY
ncbi:galactose-specific lectin nattectin-like isoform X2 [Syngnathoides biaculeatus]|uniref:galactose-specific lectin nattectin-like isoform X2 n=1 Tax=Syngnathoides biaculeatus TaxID=300417 RepID=UPI002ADE04EC|nr:galactose-specific lectin nattectin-like isoform X2 [Syngnathoides biaculeatus]